MHINSTILIVDSSFAVINLLGNKFKKEGYTVLTATSGNQAIAIIENKKPDLVISDTELKDFSGFELCRSVKLNTYHSNLVFILYSELSEAENIKQGFRSGATDYIIKPCNENELLIRIANHLTQKNILEQLEKEIFFRSNVILNASLGIKKPVENLTRISNNITLSNNNAEPILKSIKSNMDEIMQQRAFFEDMLEVVSDKFHPTDELQSFKLNEIIFDVFKLHKSNAVKKNLDFKVNFNNINDNYYFAKKSKLSKIISILVGYSIDQTDNGEVAIKCSVIETGDSTDMVEIAIANNGSCISSHLVRFIFNGYTNSKSYSNDLNKGMGLYYANELLTLLNGYLKVETVKDKGSVFTIQVPLQVVRIEIETKLESTEDTKAKVLLVEDNELNQVYISTILQSFNLSIDVANDGEVALEKILSNTYHLILTDINVPKINGIELTKRIRNVHGITTPIIAISGHSEKEFIEKCLQAGINSYVVKPFEINNFKNILFEELKQAKYTNNSVSIDTPKKSDFKYNYTKAIKLANGDKELLKKWLEHFFELIKRAREFVRLSIEEELFTGKSKVFHELINYSQYFDVSELREFILEMNAIEKTTKNNVELAKTYAKISAELDSIYKYYKDIKL